MSHERAKPSDLPQELDRIFRLVRIRSAESFSYPDDSPLKTTEATPVVNAAERRALVLSLRDALYTRCYARAPGDGRSDTGGASAGASAEAVDSIGAEEFARRLSAANRGREGWLEGWRVESVGAGGSVFASRGAERRMAAPGDYALTFAEEVPPCVGCAVTLRARKESLTLQSGGYCALGAEPPRVNEEGSVLRVYFNASPSASLILTESATTHLNEWRVPFTLKVMLRPEDRERRDTVVLYIPRADQRALFRLLEKLPARLFARLRRGVPLFTKPLREGVGLAETPTGGESFGMHRCRLLAESIVDAWLEGRQDADARLRALEYRFESEGLSLERAHLNPGGEDVRESDREDSQPRARAAETFGTLTRANVTDYLRARGLCDGVDEGAASWRVAEHHSRNRNFVVTCGVGARSFFVKQLRAQDPESFAMLRREARVYELAREDADFAALREVMPPFNAFDAAAQVTVLGAVEGENLLQLQQRLGRFPSEFGRRLGHALATIHARAGRATASNPPRAVFNLEPPGIFTAHRGGPLVRWLGAGQMRLVERVRDHTRLSHALDELAATWRRDTFIHGDIKFENCVVTNDHAGREESDSLSNIKLVDWELADFGEAAWDLGSLTQAYLALAVSDAQAEPRATLLEQLQASTTKLDGMRRAVKDFWRAYLLEAALREEAGRALVERSLLCASARLIQTALEAMRGQPQPTRLALSLFDASIEIATRTQEAARRLGLSD